MPRRLVKFLGLPWREQLLMTEAAFALLAVNLALRVGGVRACNTLIGPDRPRPDKPAPAEQLARVGQAVRRAAAPLRLHCLPQSIAVMWLLRRRGVAAELRFGAKLEAGELDAHAWVVASESNWVFDVCPAGGYAPLHNGSPR